MNDSGVVEALDCGSQLLCNVECPGSVFRSGTECLVRAYQWVAERNFLIQGGVPAARSVTRKWCPSRSNNLIAEGAYGLSAR